MAFQSVEVLGGGGSRFEAVHGEAEGFQHGGHGGLRPDGLVAVALDDGPDRTAGSAVSPAGVLEEGAVGGGGGDGNAEDVWKGQTEDAAGLECAADFPEEVIGLRGEDVFNDVLQKVGVYEGVLPGEGFCDVKVGKIQIQPARDVVGRTAQLDEDGGLLFSGLKREAVRQSGEALAGEQEDAAADVAFFPFLQLFRRPAEPAQSDVAVVAFQLACVLDL